MLDGVAQEDGAGLGFLALLDEGEVLVPGLPDLEEPGPGPDVLLFDLVRPVDDGGSAGPGHPQVVALPQPADGLDAGLFKEVLGQV